jgi:hypothetical protein
MSLVIKATHPMYLQSSSNFPVKIVAPAYLPQAAPASARPTACNSRQIPFLEPIFP